MLVHANLLNKKQVGAFIGKLALCNGAIEISSAGKNGIKGLAGELVKGRKKDTIFHWGKSCREKRNL